MHGHNLIAVASEAICACSGEVLCRRAAVDLEDGPYHLVGAGKAALAMARGVVAACGQPKAGLLVTKAGLSASEDDHGRGQALERVALHLAGHPLPDGRSEQAAAALIAYLAAVPPSDRVVVVLSGGASSLLASPAAGLTLAELALSTRALLASGLGIEALNVVRRHLTRASAGRLARACRARLEVLVLSDVLSGELAAIGSGPFAPDPSNFAEALEIARATPGMAPAAVELLLRGARGGLPETPAVGDPCFERVRHRVVGSHETLRRAAVEAARRAGFRVRCLAPSGADVGAVAAALVAAATDLAPGELLLGSGEPTVSLPSGHGCGGRNQQLALLMARALAGGPARAFLALGSDGTDGPTDAAGALVDAGSWQALQRWGDPGDALARADAHPLLAVADSLVRTGATGTNLLDLHLLAAG